ncbi:serine proteinase inhibitor [Oesophagostomum dentatum]|uniref:Serine proteinase inhibitor n=1 Tax=Oesophagostomum dentatum TaxID=61180 RepID=A0A0B1THS4_OESDE|nr:serine proteinase inhibitor [Oesophagostomum dentatum]
MAPTHDVTEGLITAETDFGLNLIRQSASNEQLVVSPLSIILALSIVRAGAKGETKEQISRAISGGAKDEEIEEYYSNLSKDVLNSTEDVQTRIASAFFMDKRFEINKHYSEIIAERYLAKVEALDFEQPNETAKIIDIFVKDTTAGKIQDFVTEDMVQGAFSLLINAVYFTAKWEHEFDRYSTVKDTFFSNENDKRRIDFLNEYQVDRLYAEDEDVQFLSLRYKDTSYAFNILLPKKRFTLHEIKEKVSGARIQQLLSQLRMTFITISIPKMSIETEFDLKKALLAMGITRMFSEEADFTAITEQFLRVSDAAHKAIIEVDEEGTTAAASTAVKMVSDSLRLEQPVEFNANHPFMFVLTKDKNPLFMGQFA